MKSLPALGADALVAVDTVHTCALVEA